MGLEDLGALVDKKADERGGPEATEQKRPLILVVDDDSGVLAALENLLKKYYRVLLCASAAEAIDAWSDEISAVILDMKMRENDGFWACEEIRKRNAYVPVIFYSAYQDAKDPFDIINQHQPFGYITKGADIRMLLGTLERAIRYYTVIAENKKAVAELQQIQAKLQNVKTLIGR